MASGGKHLKKQANNKRGSGAHLSEKTGSVRPGGAHAAPTDAADSDAVHRR